MPWSIVGWITVIVFLRVCLGLLSSSYSPCWILLLVWFMAWSALITLHPPWWICIGFHNHSASHTNCVWSCLSACVVLPLHILLTIALVLLWCLVDRLWDLLLMVTLLFLVIGLTGVWDFLTSTLSLIKIRSPSLPSSMSVRRLILWTTGSFSSVSPLHTDSPVWCTHGWSHTSLAENISFTLATATHLHPRFSMAFLRDQY